MTTLSSSGKINTDKPYPGQHHWLELDNNPRNKYLDDLFKQKIIWGEISDKPKFSIDLEGQYCPEATTFLMTGEHLKYLLGFLNSTLSEYFFAKYGTTTGVGTLRWKKYLIELLPIPVVNQNIEKHFISLVDKILLTKGDNAATIQLLDKQIFDLFDFSNKEILFIKEMIIKGVH